MRAWIVALLLVSNTAWAAAELKPYKATYITTARGMSVVLTRELKRNEDSSWVLTNGGSKMLFGFIETAVFSTDGQTIVPGSYVYAGTGLMNRRREVQFRQDGSIDGFYKDKWWKLPTEGQPLDKLSQQEQMRLQLLNDPTPMEDIHALVADGKRVKQYTIHFEEEVVLETALGPIKTLHFSRQRVGSDRRSDIWLAPQWDYLLVKVHHIENKKPVDITITSVILDGVTIERAAP